jgi:MFS family permease
MAVLLSVGFLDEFCSGVPIVGASQVRAEFGLSYTAVSFVLLALPGVSALLVEAPLLLRADHIGRRRLAVTALWVMASCSVLAAAASELWLLALAFALWSPAAGVLTAVAEASLVDARPDQAERTLTRLPKMICNSASFSARPHRRSLCEKT